MKGENKRKGTRSICKVPVLCKKDTIFDNSQTVDISDSGIGFFSQRFIPVDTNMVLEIALAPKAEPLLTVGRVKWIQKVGYLDRYRVGMEFTDIPETSKGRLSKYIEK